MVYSLIQRAAGKPYTLHAAWAYAEESGAPTLTRDAAVLVDQGRVVEVLERRGFFAG